MLISQRFKIPVVLLFTLPAWVSIIALPPQQPDNATVVRGIDASVKVRIGNLAGYTVSEHYAVFRSHDETHPAAEMFVKTVYRKDSGKSFSILSRSGSTLLLS